MSDISLLISFSLGVLYPLYRSIEHQRCELIAEVHRLEALREVERKGRIVAQRRAKEQIQSQNAESGWRLSAIGKVESQFPDRRGTPRQPILVPASRGRIHFDTSLIQYEHFKELKEFSHVWIIFVFNHNTNLDGAKVQNSRVPAKIKPPRLHGEKVGCLTTRSPHRPNPIGLSVCEIVSVGKSYLDIKGIDFVDGTVVLDVKPYIPYDSIPFDGKIAMATDANGTSLLQMQKLKVPQWIYDSDIPLRNVCFSKEALETLRFLDETRAMKLCADANEAQQLITQVLRQDIRATHQGRGQDSHTSEQTYKCRLDNFDIDFITGNDNIFVNKISFSSSRPDVHDSIGLDDV